MTSVSGPRKKPSWGVYRQTSRDESVKIAQSLFRM
jgi:hypothetical protein